MDLGRRCPGEGNVGEGIFGKEKMSDRKGIVGYLKQGSMLTGNHLFRNGFVCLLKVNVYLEILLLNNNR